MDNPSVEEALDYCLANPDGLSAEELLEMFPQHREELQPLLALSANIAQVAQTEPPPVPIERRDAMKARLQAASAPNAQAVLRPNPQSAIRLNSAEPKNPQSRKPWWLAIIGRRTLAAAATAALFLLFFWWAAASSLPDSPFYGIKLASENFMLNFAGSDADRARSHLDLANARLTEISAMGEQGKLGAAGPAIENYGTHINSCSALLGSTGASRSDIQSRLGESISRCDMIIKGFGPDLSRIPESTQSQLVVLYRTMGQVGVAINTTPPQPPSELVNTGQLTPLAAPIETATRTAIIPSRTPTAQRTQTPQPADPTETPAPLPTDNSQPPSPTAPVSEPNPTLILPQLRTPIINSPTAPPRQTPTRVAPTSTPRPRPIFTPTTSRPTAAPTAPPTPQLLPTLPPTPVLPPPATQPIPTPTSIPDPQGTITSEPAVDTPTPLVTPVPPIPSVVPTSTSNPQVTPPSLPTLPIPTLPIPTLPIPTLPIPTPNPGATNTPAESSCSVDLREVTIDCDGDKVDWSMEIENLSSEDVRAIWTAELQAQLPTGTWVPVGLAADTIELRPGGTSFRDEFDEGLPLGARKIRVRVNIIEAERLDCRDSRQSIEKDPCEVN